jgi:hypothetical protein
MPLHIDEVGIEMKVRDGSVPQPPSSSPPPNTTARWRALIAASVKRVLGALRIARAR